jgi:hypothetical protein
MKKTIVGDERNNNERIKRNERNNIGRIKMNERTMGGSK